MTPKHSMHRVAALTGAAAFLFSLAHVSPAAAQTSTRHTASCVANASPGNYTAECQMVVPSGKVFVIESASVTGYHPSIHYVQVLLATKAQNATRFHAIPAGFQVLSNSRTYWSGALPGTVYSDPGWIRLEIFRGPGSSGWMGFEVTLSGRLEDI
jgi:hypothetical protein